MIKTLNFGQKLNINQIARAECPLLRKSQALLGQPLHDEVSLTTLNLGKCKKILLEKFYPENTTIKLLKEIEIEQNQNGITRPVKAFLTETQQIEEDEFGYALNGFAIFSKEGHLLGDIDKLIPNWQLDYKKSKTIYPEIKNYLFLHNLNASYQPGYKGVGKALIEAATQKSQELELEGQIGLKAYNNVKDSTKGSPIPFYAKLGFVPKDAPNMSKEQIIEKYKSGNECVTMFLLNSENLEKLKEYKKKHPPKGNKPNITDRLMQLLFHEQI